MLKKAPDDDVVMTLVERALAKPEHERETFLKDACSDDSELFEHVWNYVQWEGRMNGFLLEPFYSAGANEHPFEPGEPKWHRAAWASCMKPWMKNWNAASP